MKINPGQSNQGIALIIVMLVILVLATLAGAFAYSMKIEATLARNANYESQLEWMGRSGIELARFAIAQQSTVPNEGNYESLNQIWAGGTGGVGASNSALASISLENIPMGQGVINKIAITDLERKFNINLADHSALQQAMTIMGVDANLSPEIADAILDWMDPDEDAHLSGVESDYYLGLDPPYVAKNGPMDDISELLLIKGIYENPAVYWGASSTNYLPDVTRGSQPFGDPYQPNYPVGLMDIFTTLSSGKININTASATTLQMIPTVDESIAVAIIQTRSGLDGIDGTEDDVPFQNFGELRNVPGMDNPQIVAQLGRYCDVRSHTFEVEVEVEINGVKRVYYGVIRRGARAGDFAVLKFFWK